MAVRPEVLWTAAICVLVASFPETCGQCSNSDRPKVMWLNSIHTVLRVKSPNYPSHFPSNSLCEWQIKTRSDHVIHVHVTDVEMEGSYGDCMYDYVTLYDGDPRAGVGSGRKSYLARLCSEGSAGSDYYSQGPLLSVQFRSDPLDERRGFSLSVKTVHKSKAVTPSPPTDENGDSSNFFTDNLVALTVCPTVLVCILITVCVFYREYSRDDSNAQTPSSGPLLGPKPPSDSHPSSSHTVPYVDHGARHGRGMVMVRQPASAGHTSRGGRPSDSPRGHDVTSHAAALSPKAGFGHGDAAGGEPVYYNQDGRGGHPHLRLSPSIDRGNRGGQLQMGGHHSYHGDLRGGPPHQTARSRETSPGRSRSDGDRGGWCGRGQPGHGDDDGTCGGIGGGEDAQYVNLPVQGGRAEKGRLPSAAPPSYDEATTSSPRRHVMGTEKDWY